MSNNAFIKFKDYLKELRESLKKEKKNKEKTLTIFRDVMQNKATTFLLKKEVDKLHDLYGNINNTSTDEILSNFRCDLEFWIEQDGEYIKNIQKLINALGNDSAISIINDVNFLVYCLIDAYQASKISYKDFKTILGSAIKFNSKKVKRFENTQMKPLIIQLGKYFSIDGKFLVHENPNIFAMLMKELFVSNPKPYYCSIDYPRQLIELLEQVKNGMVSDYEEEYLKKLMSDLEEEPVIKLASKEIVFAKEDEQATHEESQSIFTEEEQELLKKASKEIDSYSDKSKQLLGILRDLQNLDALQKECLPEDMEYLNEEKTSLFEALRILITPWEQEKAKTNLIYLVDSNCNPYIKGDLEEIDNSVKKRVYSLLGKIKKENTKNFRRVEMTHNPGFNVMEVNNKDTHIVFLEISTGIYLVLGASYVGKNYKEITNRILYSGNTEYIKSLMSGIKDKEFREKILLEQQAFERGMKLVRSVDN